MEPFVPVYRVEDERRYNIGPSTHGCGKSQNWGSYLRRYSSFYYHRHGHYFPTTPELLIFVIPTSKLLFLEENNLILGPDTAGPVWLRAGVAESIQVQSLTRHLQEV